MMKIRQAQQQRQSFVRLLQECFAMNRHVVTIYLFIICMIMISSCMIEVASSNIVSTAEARLPMSITTVVTDLEAEGCHEVYPVCLLVSRSVTSIKKQILVQNIFRHNKSNDDDDDDDQPSSSSSSSSQQYNHNTVIGLSSGIVLVQPSTLSDAISCVTVCDGTIIYYPDPIDLIRDEGLFDTLAPAMEKILHLHHQNNLLTNDDEIASSSYMKPTLYVIGTDESIQTRFEQAATAYLSNIIIPGNGPNGNDKIMTLQDVFEQVVYVSVEDAIDVMAEDVVTNNKKSMIPSMIASKVAYMATNPIISTPPSADLTPLNLAAARLLGPGSRYELDKCFDDIERSCYDLDESNNKEEDNYKFVATFGELCNVAITLALQRIHDEYENSGMIRKSNTFMGKHIHDDLLSNLDIQLSKLYEKQLILLTQISFDELKKRISKLLISPNLESDMYQQMKQSFRSYQSNMKQLIPTKYFTKNWYSMAQSYYYEYQRQCQEYIQNRIITAKVSGQYKPLPRKGITVGLHYLLPKPFGNDYRQEPWMVHATDDMVYIPPHKKLSDVAVEDIKAGTDWRQQIIPNPAGNDMLYMQ